MVEKKLLEVLFNAILKMVTPENIKAFAIFMIDFAETKAKESETDFDDKLCELARLALGIPKNDK